VHFSAPAKPAGKHVYLEIGDVHDYAHVTLNGKEVGARSFQPYRWDVTGDLKPGANELKIEVYGTAGQGRGAGGAPPAAAAPPAPGLMPLPAGAGTAPPTAGGAGRAAAVPAASGLLSPVRLMAY
jgi:beta-galactosidase/beta-glucuronidase